MTITKLKPSQLYKKCDPQKFSFVSTAELEERLSSLGQNRALAAVELGINIQSKGYNLFCLGPEGTGKSSLVKRVLAQEAKLRKTPDDWVYVYNFDEPYKPWAISFPAGTATDFAKDIDKLIENLAASISAIFESEEYNAGVNIIKEKFKQSKEKYIKMLQKKAKGKSVSLLHMPVGLVVAPVKNGEVLSPEAFDSLPEEEKKQLIEDLNQMQAEIENSAQDLPAWEDKQRDEINNLRTRFLKETVKGPIDELHAKYKGHRQANEFLKQIQKYILDNGDEFLPEVENNVPVEGEDPLSALLSKMKQPEEDRYAKFKVNVIVKNEPDSGAPIIHLDHPTQGNLVGKVERIQQYGALLTDFTLIKAGALHKANGGFLLVDARKLLLQPFAWDSLKRAIASKQIKIEAPSEETSFTTISLDPQPIPLDVKIILTGDAELYELLSERDPEFLDFFKVEADFDILMDRTKENEVEYAKLIGSLSKKKKLRSLNKQAVAKVIEYASRMAESSEKLTAHIASIGDLLREADYWARKSKSNHIGKNHIDQAINAKLYRNGRIKEMMLEQIDKGTILIDVKGKKVGQINGLVVYNFSRYSFGKPSRITAQVRIGKGEFVNIEREVEMSGPIHSKGVLILESLLANRFAKYCPLSLSASIVFEQSYGGVDGDSASSTEYYCLLSAITGLPIKQNIAVTGLKKQLRLMTQNKITSSKNCSSLEALLLADNQINNQQYIKASRILSQINQQTPSPALAGLYLYIEAKMAFYKGDLLNSSSWCNQAITLFKKQKLFCEMADTYFLLGQIYQTAELHDASELTLREALKIFKNIHRFRGCAQVLYNLGIITASQERWNETRQFFNEALNFTNQISDKLLNAKIKCNLALLDVCLNNHHHALSILNNLKIDNKHIELHAFRNDIFAQAHFALRHYPTARRFATEAHSLYSSICNHKAANEISNLINKIEKQQTYKIL